MERETSIRDLFDTARDVRQELDSYPDSTSAIFQKSLHVAIAQLEECRQLIDRLAFFSPNETLEDIASGDLQFLLADYYLADLIVKDNTSDRKAALRRAQNAYQRYLHLIDTYSILSKDDQKLHERFSENPDGFALIPGNDPATRRDTKIGRLKHEKELKMKLEYLRRVPHALHGDDAELRELYLAEIELSTHHTFHALDMIAQELQILALMPVPPTPSPEQQERDYRERNGQGSDKAYSERLDPPLSELLDRGKAGPILDKDGKPLKPFTLISNRQQLRNGVFKPGHNLPTMSIDEYLEEEKRRGGIIDGGGDASGRPAALDEDNMDKADEETMKAREWDEFTEANPKGSGNTINRG